MTAINPNEVQFYLANSFAGAGFTIAGVPGNSLGKFMSTTQIYTAQPLDDLFPDITGAQNAGGQVDYQCLFMFNNTASNNFMKTPFVWLPTQLYTTGGANIAVGQDPTGPVPFNSTAIQAVQILMPTSAPPGVTSFIGPTAVFSQGIKVPDIPPGFCLALWLQRTATNSPPIAPQSFSVQCTFTTNA